MPWYDIFKNLFKIDLSKFKALINFDNIHLHINSNNQSEKLEYHDSSRELTINLDTLTPEEVTTIKNILKSALEEGQVFLEKDSQALVKDFKVEDQSEETQKILTFLKPLIPLEDISIWRAALFLRKRFNERKDISSLKEDIMLKYGERGKNIANLCTSDYIKQWLMPMHNYLKESLFSPELIKEKFMGSYSALVNYLPVTIFVCQKMNPNQIKDEIIKKAKLNIRYGIKFIFIHGIGKTNVEKIKEAIPEVEKIYPQIAKTINEEKTMISVRLDFLDDVALS